MRRFLFTFFILLFSAGNVAYAGTSIAVVDVLQILTHSQAAKAIKVQRESLRAQFLEEVSVAEQALREEEKQLLEARGELPQADYQTKRQVYETQLLETRKMAQDKKRLLEEASGEALDRLREELYTVTKAIANERGFDLVISNKNVIAGETSLDITQETMKRINAALPSIELNLKAHK